MKIGRQNIRYEWHKSIYQNNLSFLMSPHVIATLRSGIMLGHLSMVVHDGVITLFMENGISVSAIHQFRELTILY